MRSVSYRPATRLTGFIVGERIPCALRSFLAKLERNVYNPDRSQELHGYQRNPYAT